MARTIVKNITGSMKNYLINGNFDFWQRGTSFAVNARSYGPDRFIQLRGVAGMTVSRQLATGSPFTATYFARIQRDSGNANTTTLYFGQNVETLNSLGLAGKVATFSFWARAGANYSATSNILESRIETGTGTDQPGLGIGAFTGSVQTITNHTLTAGWQQFSVTITVPANATQIQVHLRHNPTGTAGVSDYFDVGQLMLNEGGLSTFNLAGSSIGNELALCQRYYYVVQNVHTTGWARSSASDASGDGFHFPVTMRTTPVGTANLATSYILHVPNQISVNPTTVSLQVLNENIWYLIFSYGSIPAGVWVCEMSGGPNRFEAEL